VVFQKMKDNAGTHAPSAVNSSDAKAIKAYFKNIFPEFDEERVYVSDMKKMLKWFEILNGNDLLNFEEEVAEEVVTEEAPAEEAPAAEEKPKKAAAKKKKADVAEEGTEAAAEKPAKKTARKKKTEE